MQCLSDNGKFLIKADVDFAAKTIYEMKYYKKTKNVFVEFKSFSNLEMDHSNNIFTGRQDLYDVAFEGNQATLYLEFYINKAGQIYGNFIPSTSLFTLERDIDCEYL